jgi:hypothetical protein
MTERESLEYYRQRFEKIVEVVEERYARWLNAP